MTAPCNPPIAREGQSFGDYLIAWNVALATCGAKLDAIRIYSGE